MRYKGGRGVEGVLGRAVSLLSTPPYLFFERDAETPFSVEREKETSVEVPSDGRISPSNEEEQKVDGESLVIR